MNWLKLIFTKRKNNRPREKNFFWFIFNEISENQALKHYCFSEARKSCSLLTKMPSKDLARKYGFKPESGNGIAWYVLEKYFNGELIEKNDSDSHI